MRGAVLGLLKAEFSFVAMKAGCMRAFETFPPPPPPVLIGHAASLTPY
jgi:hypothetical protein